MQMLWAVLAVIGFFCVGAGIGVLFKIALSLSGIERDLARITFQVEGRTACRTVVTDSDPRL